MSTEYSYVIPHTDDDDDDDYFEEEDMFSRLEANRANLEQELGCELFMKAYKTVQVWSECDKIFIL